MILFWILSALLAGVALWFIVPPLIGRRAGARHSQRAANIAVYRDQLRELDTDVRAGTLSAEQYEKARSELEARLLEDVEGAGDAPAATQPSRAMAAAVAILIPAGALGIYFAVGTPAALTPGAASVAGAPHAADMKQLEQAVEKLAARLKDNPDNTEGWIMLARSYKLFGRFGESAQAYAQAVTREPRDAALLADYADMLAMAQGRRLQGEPEKIIARALEIDPRNLKALALAGSVAFEKKDYVAAVAQWERMLPLLPADSEDARGVEASIAEARSLGGGFVAQPSPKAAPASTSTSGVSGTVMLAPELAGKVAPGDTVFIFARPAEGPRIPLAILRKQARELPAAFKLDDSMAMSAEMKLSKFPRVVVGARVSRSGSATPQPGDLEGMSAPVENTASGLTVTIAAAVR